MCNVAFKLFPCAVTQNVYNILWKRSTVMRGFCHLISYLRGGLLLARPSSGQAEGSLGTWGINFSLPGITAVTWSEFTMKHVEGKTVIIWFRRPTQFGAKKILKKRTLKMFHNKQLTKVMTVQNLVVLSPKQTGNSRVIKMTKQH